MFRRGPTLGTMQKPSLWLVVFVFALSVGVAWGGRNSTGSYSLPTGNPVTSGTTITSSWANGTLSDIGTELTNSLDRQGRGAMQAALQLANGTNLAPSLTFASEPGSGFYRSALNDLRFMVGGNQVCRMQPAALTFNVATTASAAFTAASSFTTSASGITFSDATTQTTSATARADKSGITAGASMSAGSTVTKLGSGMVEAVLSFTASGAIAKGSIIGTLTNSAGWPAHDWYGNAYRVRSAVDGAAVPIGIGHLDGQILVEAALNSGDQLFVTAVYLGP